MNAPQNETENEVIPLTDDELRQIYGMEVVSDDHSMSLIGGLKPFLAYLKKGQFRERLEQVVGPHSARSMLQLMIGIISGCEDIRHHQRRIRPLSKWIFGRLR